MKIMKRHKEHRNLNKATLIIVLFGVFVIAGYLFVQYYSNQNGQPRTDKEGQLILKEEAEIVANSFNSDLRSANVTRDECTNHKFTRVCYFDATVDIGFSSASELRENANSNGWDSNGTNSKYEYCHSLLRIEDTDDGPKLKIHCYVSID